MHLREVHMATAADTQAEMDRALERADRGRAMAVLGGTMVGMAGITCVWILTGWRAGSLFWFWVTGSLGVLGLSSIAAGTGIRDTSVREIEVLGQVIRARVAAQRRMEERPAQPEGDIPRAA